MKYNKIYILVVFLVSLVLLTVYVMSCKCATIDSVWCINLDRDTERLEAYKQHGERFGAPVYRWPATYGRDVDRMVASHTYGVTHAFTRSSDPEENKKNPNILYQPGVFGCWISHKRLMTHLSTLSLPSSHGHLITEDDIIVPTDFQEQWNSIRKTIPCDWDIVYLYTGKTRGDPVAPRVLRWKNDTASANTGTVAYLVRHGAVHKILKELKYMDSPIDVQYYRRLAHLNIYIVNPALITTGDFESSILTMNAK